MSKKLIPLLFTLVVLVFLSASYVVGGLQAYSRFQQESIASQLHCGGSAPVHICIKAPLEVFSAFYPYYSTIQYPLFTVEYSSTSATTLAISVNISGFSRTETHSVDATATMQSVNFTPTQMNDALSKLTTDQNVPLHIEVSDMLGQRHLYYVNDISLRLRSRWLMQWQATNRLQIGAWVTPNDPAIKTVIARATRHLQAISGTDQAAMVGYNNATGQQVIDQVNAIYDTLRLDYAMHYIEAPVPYGGPGDSSTAIQNIKLPAEILRDHGGMCIELSVLMAAAVERIGLHAEIVITSGHAFLGVATADTASNQHFEYWDAVQINNNVAGESDNIAADTYYTQHQIVDRILIADARKAGIGPMVPMV